MKNNKANRKKVLEENLLFQLQLPATLTEENAPVCLCTIEKVQDFYGYAPMDAHDEKPLDEIDYKYNHEFKLDGMCPCGQYSTYQFKTENGKLLPVVQVETSKPMGGKLPGILRGKTKSDN